MTTPGTGEVETFLGLLIVVAAVAAVVRFVRLPYTVALVLTGLGLAFLPNIPSVQLTPAVILSVFLPVLLFYGAYNLHFDELRVSIRPVSLLAVPGVAATAVLVGGALHLTTSLSWSEGLLFGAIVAATDPVAVLSIFGDLQAPRRLHTIVAAESLFNDGTALIFFATMLTVVTAQSLDVGFTVERFAVDLVGSLALGVAVGGVGSHVVHRIDDALIETTLTLIIAYGGYLLADRLGISGPLETVAAGIVLGLRGTDVMSPTSRLQAGAIWEFLDFVANSLIFLLMGLALKPIGHITATHLGSGIWWPMLVAIVAVVASRGLVVALVSRLLAVTGGGFPAGWSIVIGWAGLRGAVSFAAALSLPVSLPERDLLLTLTFGVVLFTLAVQGMTMPFLLDRLGISESEHTGREMEMIRGRLQVVDAARREVEGLLRTSAIDEHLGQQLLGEYREQQSQLSKQLDSLYHRSGIAEAEQEREARRRVLRVQQEAARSAYAHGQLSHSAFRELTADIDLELGHLEAEAE